MADPSSSCFKTGSNGSLMVDMRNAALHVLRAAIAFPRESTAYGRVGLSEVHRRVTPWRELTRDCSLRPGGASLLAKTGRSEQDSDRSRAQWSRLVPPPPLFHRTYGLCRRAPGYSRQGEGCTTELDSSSLAPGVGPLHLATTPTGREEPGTRLYPSYNDPPGCAPRPRQACFTPGRQFHSVRIFILGHLEFEYGVQLCSAFPPPHRPADSTVARPP